MDRSKKIIKLDIKDALLIRVKLFKDHRGEFTKIFSSDFFKKKYPKIKQINISLNYKAGTLRGMHLQSHPFTEDKYVSCIEGKIQDVILDLRKNSKTYEKWLSVDLSKRNGYILKIPKGCAHGFQSLADNSRVIYYHTNTYNKKYEKNINPLSDHYKIKWKKKITKISKKDNKAND